MVQQSMGVNEIELAELARVDLEHVRDDERASVAESRTSVPDVPLAEVEADVLDVRQILEDVAGTTPDVEHAIAGLRAKTIPDDRALERPGADDAHRAGEV